MGGDLGLTVNSAFGPAKGKVELGDRIVACNGRLTRTMDHTEAEHFLAAHDHITLTLERSAAVKEMFDRHMNVVKTSLRLSSMMSPIENLVITRPSLEEG